MFNRKTLFFYIFSLCATSVYAQVDIILEEGVKTYLQHITQGMLRETTPTDNVSLYDLGVLSLGREAELYITESSHFKAHSIFLDEQAKIQLINGGHLKIQCQIFDAGKNRLEKESLGVISVEVHPKIFNPQSAQSHFETLREPEHAFFNSKDNYGKAQPGRNGRHGQDGKDGASAGTLTLEAGEFYGGLFLARGGHGQEGAQGQEGGKGGNGVRFPKELVKDYPQLYFGAQLSPFDEVIDGASGGYPGRGGHGGNGGRGGSLIFSFGENYSHNHENFFVLVHGGFGGRAGEKGLPGMAGEKGNLTYPRLVNHITIFSNAPAQVGETRNTPIEKALDGKPGPNGEVR